MSYVYIYASQGDEVRFRAATHMAGEYVVNIGEATLFLPREKATELRDALAAALDDEAQRQDDTAAEPEEGTR